MNSKPKQCDRLLFYLQEHKKITQMEALIDLGIMRLASRISELKKQGYVINKRMIAVKNRFDEKCSIAEYYVEE